MRSSSAGVRWRSPSCVTTRHAVPRCGRSDATRYHAQSTMGQNHTRPQRPRSRLKPARGLPPAPNPSLRYTAIIAKATYRGTSAPCHPPDPRSGDNPPSSSLDNLNCKCDVPATALSSDRIGHNCSSGRRLSAAEAPSGQIKSLYLQLVSATTSGLWCDCLQTRGTGERGTKIRWSPDFDQSFSSLAPCGCARLLATSHVAVLAQASETPGSKERFGCSVRGAGGGW